MSLLEPSREARNSPVSPRVLVAYFASPIWARHRPCWCQRVVGVRSSAEGSVDTSWEHINADPEFLLAQFCAERTVGSVSESGTVSRMSESLRVTIVYEQGDDGWVIASVPEVPGTHSQGQTRDEARANVIDALRGMLELRFGEHAPAATAVDSEPLELVIGA